jgi:hypothetical protein
MPESGSGSGQPGKSAAFARQPGINGVTLVVNRAYKRYEERNQKNDDGSMGTIPSNDVVAVRACCPQIRTSGTPLSME